MKKKEFSLYNLFLKIFLISQLYWVFLILYWIISGFGHFVGYIEEIMVYTFSVFLFVLIYQILFIIYWLERKRKIHRIQNKE